MLLATIDDVRAVLIKLAFRVQRLRGIKRESSDVQQCIARETMDIYSPLANRLGISSLKWEIEDLAFRFLNPSDYHELARSMAEKRTDREVFIREFVDLLESMLEKQGFTAHIVGRPKHLYSIWKKMQRKNMAINELYDLLAVRIMATDISQCYIILGLIHQRWQHIPKEFDDYIANPKDNGYQSIHTAIIGPGNNIIEIQIRTREMHDFAEHGVAAHWRYKEGSQQDIALEKAITTLRKLLENRIDDDTLLEEFKTELFSDRVMVLTPKQEIRDFPKGATVLDFAYAIHTEVGHHCVGATVNGHRVPLSYALNSGERVEILTDAESWPHLNWLNHRKKYFHLASTRTRIRQWMKNFYRNNDNHQLIDSRHIRGIGNHVIHIASCCRPQIGDPVTGHLLPDTHIDVHHQDCQQLKKFQIQSPRPQLIELFWGEPDQTEKVNIHIDAFDRMGLLQDITTLLNHEEVNVIKANTETDSVDQSVGMDLVIELNDLSQLDALLRRICLIPNIFNAEATD